MGILHIIRISWSSHISTMGNKSKYLLPWRNIRKHYLALAMSSSTNTGGSIDDLPKYVMKSPWGTLSVPRNMTFPELMLRRCLVAPEKTALIDNHSGEKLNYKQTANKISALAASLSKHGVGKGSVVSVCSHNCLEMALLLLAIPATGACVSPMNTMLSKGELNRMLDMGPTDYLITTPELLVNFVDRSSQLKKIFIIGQAVGYTSVGELLCEGNPKEMTLPVVDPVKHPAMMCFSSGTTGLSKGTLLSHFSVIAGILASSTASTGCAVFTDKDIAVNIFPFVHIGGSVIVMMNALYSLSTLVVVDRYDFEEFLQANEKYKATMLIMPPSVGVRMLNDPIVDKYDLSTVGKALSGAAPISDVVQKGLCERLKLSSFRQAYGMTELSGMSHVDCIENSRYGSVGFPVPNVMCKIVDPDSGEDLPLTSTGEICVKGPITMIGYLKNPEANAEIFDDGWIKTGDIGHHDEDGYLYITDRLKDLIKYKALQVAPAELEGVLLGNPLVADAGVIGVPDEYSGEVPMAFVVLKKGLENSQRSERDIIEYVADRVSPFKQLRGGVRFVESIPKLASGKILRRVLRQQYSDNTKSKL